MIRLEDLQPGALVKGLVGPWGIDEATARIVLENSAALNVDSPGLY